MKSRSKAFTLIELLVVISIIALLVSMLVPGLNRAKLLAKTIACQCHLRQLGLAFKMYTDDNNGSFTPDLGHERYAAISRPELYKYYRDNKLLLCPMASKTYADGARNPFGAWQGDEPDDPMGNPPCSYAINSWICNPAPGQEGVCSGHVPEYAWRTPNVKGAAYAPMVFDCAGYQNALPWHYDEPPLFDGEFITGTSQNEMRYACINRHSEHVNMVFCDFGVRKVGLKELWELKWNRNWNPKNAPPPASWKDPTHWMYGMKDYAVYP